MTPQEFIQIQGELGLNNRQLGEKLGLSRKTIDCYRSAPGKADHRKITGPVACAMEILLENKKLKTYIEHKKEIVKKLNRKYYYSKKLKKPKQTLSEIEKKEKLKEYQKAYSFLRRKNDPAPLEKWRKKWSKKEINHEI